MDGMTINPLDIAVLVVLLLSAALAFARGFTQEILSIGGWILAVLAALHGLAPLRSHARALIPNETAADITTGVVLFLVTLIVLSLIARAVAKTVKSSPLSALDRSLGVVFGLLRGALIIAILYIPIAWLAPPSEHPAWAREAKTMPVIAGLSGWVQAMAPESLRLAERRAGDASERARDAMEAERLLRPLLQPETGSGARADDDAGASGYTRQEQREMERLIQQQSN